MAPATMKGFRRPHLERQLSDQAPISGSNKASMARGMASNSPTRKGFIPRPIFSTTFPRFPMAFPISV